MLAAALLPLQVWFLCAAVFDCSVMHTSPLCNGLLVFPPPPPSSLAHAAAGAWTEVFEEGKEASKSRRSDGQSTAPRDSLQYGPARGSSFSLEETSKVAAETASKLSKALSRPGNFIPAPEDTPRQYPSQTFMFSPTAAAAAAAAAAAEKSASGEGPSSTPPKAPAASAPSASSPPPPPADTSAPNAVRSSASASANDSGIDLSRGESVLREVQELMAQLNGGAAANGKGEAAGESKTEVSSLVNQAQTLMGEHENLVRRTTASSPQQTKEAEEGASEAASHSGSARDYVMPSSAYEDSQPSPSAQPRYSQAAINPFGSPRGAIQSSQTLKSTKSGISFGQRSDANLTLKNDWERDAHSVLPTVRNTLSASTFKKKYRGVSGILASFPQLKQVRPCMTTRTPPPLPVTCFL